MTATNWPALGKVGSVACVALASLGRRVVGLVGPGSPHAPARSARTAMAAAGNAAPLVCIVMATSFGSPVVAHTEPLAEEPLARPVCDTCGWPRRDTARRHATAP